MKKFGKIELKLFEEIKQLKRELMYAMNERKWALETNQENLVKNCDKEIDDIILQEGKLIALLMLEYDIEVIHNNTIIK